MDLSIQENDNWVQCDKCEKWRKLPSNTDISKLTNTWYCSLNGDTRYNSCEIEEENVISSQYNLNNNNISTNNNPTNLSDESYKNVDSLKDGTKFESEFYNNKTQVHMNNNKIYVSNNNEINNYQHNAETRKQINNIHNEESISQNSNNLNIYINQRNNIFFNHNYENNILSNNIISSNYNNKNKYDIKKNKEDKKKQKNKYNTNKKEYENETILNNIPLDFGNYSGKGVIKSPSKIIKKINHKKKQINSEQNNVFSSFIYSYDEKFYNHNNNYTINMLYSKYSKKNINKFNRSNSDGDIYRHFKSRISFNTQYYSDTNSDCHFRDNIRMHKKNYNNNNNSSFYSSMHSIVNNILKKKQKTRKQSNDKNKNEKYLITSLNSSNLQKNSNNVLKENKNHKKKSNKYNISDEEEFDDTKIKKNKKIKEIVHIKNEIDLNESYDKNSIDNKDVSIFQNICKDETGNIIGENNSKETNKYIHNMNKIKNYISKKNETNSEKKKNHDIKINQPNFNQNKTNKSDKNINIAIYNETNLNSNSYNSENVLINKNHMGDDNKNYLEKNNNPLNNVVNWVQCENCKKWRKVDAHVNVTKLPDEWYCSLNFWNKYNNCDAEEEIYIEDNLTHKNINNLEKNQNDNILDNFPKDKNDKNSKQGKTKGKNSVDNNNNIKHKNYKNCKNLTNKYEINNPCSNFNDNNDYVEKYPNVNNIDYKKLLKNKKIDQHWNSICAFIKFINSYDNKTTNKNVWSLRNVNSMKRSNSFSCYENKTVYFDYEHDKNYLSDSFLQIKISKKKLIQKNKIYNYKSKTSQFFYNQFGGNTSYDNFPYHLYPNKGDMIKFNKTHITNDNKIFENNDNGKGKLEQINEPEDEQNQKGNSSHIQDSRMFQIINHNNTKHADNFENVDFLENEHKCDGIDDSKTNQGDSNKNIWNMLINKFRINKWKGNVINKNDVNKNGEADTYKCNSTDNPKSEKEETNKCTYNNIFDCDDTINDFYNERKYEIMRNYVLYNRKKMGNYLNYEKCNGEAKKKNNNNSDVFEGSQENNNAHNYDKHLEMEKNNINPYIYSTKSSSYEQKSNIDGDLYMNSDSKNDIKILFDEYYLNNENVMNTPPKSKSLNSSDINYHKFLISNNNKMLTQKSNSFSRLSTNEFVNFPFEEYNDENISPLINQSNKNIMITENEINNNFIKLENEKLYNSFKDDINKLDSENQIKINDDLNNIHNNSDKKKNKILPNYEKFIASVNYFNSLSSQIYYPDELMKTIPMENINETILNNSNNLYVNNILMKKQKSYNNNDSREKNANVKSLVNDYLNVIENTKPVQNNNNNKGRKKMAKIIPTKNPLKNYIINSNKNEASIKKNAKQNQHVQQLKLNNENKNSKNKSNDKNALKKDLIGGNAGNRKDVEKGDKNDKSEKNEKNENNEYITFSMRCNENKNIIKELIRNRNNTLNAKISKGNASNHPLSYNDIDDEYDGKHIKTTILNAKNLKKHILSSRVIIYSKGASLTFNVEEINKNSIYFYNNEEIDIVNGNNATEFNSNNTNVAANNSNTTNTNNKNKKNIDDANKDLQNDIESSNIYFNYAHNINFSDNNNIELNKMKKVVTQVFTYDYKKLVNEISLFNDNIKLQIPNLKYKFKKYTHLDDDKNKGKKKQIYQSQLDNQTSHSYTNHTKEQLNNAIKNNEYNDENCLDGKNSNVSNGDENYDKNLNIKNSKKSKIKLKNNNNNSSIDYYKNDDTKNNTIKKKNKGKITKNNKKNNTINLETSKNLEISDNHNFSENDDQDKTKNEIYYSKEKITTNKNILKPEMIIINDQIRTEKLKKVNKTQPKHVAKNNTKILFNNDNIINNDYDSFKIVKQINNNKIKKISNNDNDEEEKETTNQQQNEYKLELEKSKHEQNIIIPNDLTNLTDQIDKKNDKLLTDNNNMDHILKSKEHKDKNSDNIKQKYNYSSGSTLLPNEFDGNSGEQSRKRKRKYSNNDNISGDYYHLDDKQNKIHKKYKKNKMGVTNNNTSQNEGSSAYDGNSNIYEEDDNSQIDQDIYDNNKNKHKNISKHWNESSYKSKESRRPISSDRKSNRKETNFPTDNHLQDKESKDESGFFIIDTSNRSKRKRCILDDDEEEADYKQIDYNKKDDSNDHKKRCYDANNDRDKSEYNKHEKEYYYYKDKYYDDKKYHKIKRKKSYSNDSPKNKYHENYFEKEEYGKSKYYDDKYYRYKKMYHNNTFNKNEIDKNKYYNRNTNQYNYYDYYRRNSYSSYSENNDDSDARYYYNKRNRDDKNSSRPIIENEEYREHFYHNHHKEYHEYRSKDSLNDIHNNKIHRNNNKSIESEKKLKENKYNKSYDSANYKTHNYDDNNENETNFNNKYDKFNKNNGTDDNNGDITHMDNEKVNRDSKIRNRSMTNEDNKYDNIHDVSKNKGINKEDMNPKYYKNNNPYYSDKYDDRHSNNNEHDKINKRFSKKYDFKYEHQNENKYNKYGEYEKHNTKYENNRYDKYGHNNNKYDNIRHDCHHNRYNNSRIEDRRYDRNEHYRYDRNEYHNKYERNGNNYEKYPNKYNNSNRHNIINKYEKKIKHDDEELFSNNTIAPPNSEEKNNTNKTYKTEDNLKSKNINEDNNYGHPIDNNDNNNKDELNKYNGEKYNTEKNNDEKNEQHERNSERRNIERDDNNNGDIISGDYEKKYPDYNKYEKEHYPKNGGKKTFYHPENYYKNKHTENYNDDEYHYKKYNKNYDYYGNGEKYSMNNNYNRNGHFHTYSNKKLINKNYKNYYPHRNNSPTRDDIIKNKMRNEKFTNMNNSKYGNNIHIKQNRIHKF
ncbi:zinc finger protein, putative [Plasmodium berghei]|uniref:Zinc finger protein, putative n=2 Tax=Plasmodium berghei TaxID=5821 RepID=A0A509AJ47_PLABA|nr:zinc finger protein, putative [Plasmodium berghei ANKA]CXI12656.1 zinc finger protein, putative [Plasmodium berghei]SCL93382.1 zinc finger protein, putative [Plasmodium berghei]SCM15850.1 zinc finger protein, putative [Plasmodium berghei]SCM17646.1 zinc finger protein, putative [Plasmodium berghei]SCN23171.1 zinc finger protein, putative [Plasmodium berghei]|eukprot:XP_034420454.1 zinc finger protein, putative [Plasmodium berghei ANKA]